MHRSILSLALAGLAFLGSPLVGAQDYVANGAEIIKAANWDEMETLNIVLSEHDFEPRHLKLKANKPYRLVLRNTGEADHYYTAGAFFKSVAWRKIMTPRPHGGEIKGDYFTAVEVFKKGGVVELYIVPVEKDQFEVLCTIDDHKDKGMSGSITVE